MANLLASVNLSYQAMMAHQMAVEIAQHNVANANTPGYRRQAASLVNAPAPAYAAYDLGTGAGLQGMGVRVDRIQRFSLDFYDNRYRQIAADSKGWDVQQQSLKQVESLLAESSSAGLLPILDKFWAGWQALSANPEENALRVDIINQSQTLAAAFNTRARLLTSARSDINLSVMNRVDEVNGLAQNIANLNQQISLVISTGNQPNDLLDERDRSLDRLSELTGAVSSIQPNGEVLVTVGSHILVLGHNANQIHAEKNSENSGLSDLKWEDGQAVTLYTGELAGLLTARDGELKLQQTGLDSLANELITRLNDVHSQGYGLNNRTGLNLFSGTSALSMQLSSDISHPNDIAAASGANLTGDNTAAVNIWNIRNELLMGGQTVHTYYNNQLTRLGQAVNYAGAQKNNSSLILKSLDMQRESLTGVSLDEEAANIVKSQRAFEAAARVMTTIDQMLDKIINGMGIVGR